MTKMIDGCKLILALSDWWYSSFGSEETEESKAIHKVLDEVERYVDHEKSADDWIPVSERFPEEHDWIGTKRFGTTKSDLINITFEVDGQRFVKVMSLQNGELGLSDRQTMDVFYKGWKMIAWKPLPEPYKGGDEE